MIITVRPKFSGVAMPGSPFQCTAPAQPKNKRAVVPISSARTMQKLSKNFGGTTRLIKLEVLLKFSLFFLGSCTSLSLELMSTLVVMFCCASFELLLSTEQERSVSARLIPRINWFILS